VKVHPEFRAIFTSNPQEYAGVHAVQDALSDRLITMDLDYYDRETEIMITMARSGLDKTVVTCIVDVVRDFRASGQYDQIPTMRACIMIARVAAQQSLSPRMEDTRFVRVCLDVLGSKRSFHGQSQEQRERQHKLLLGIIERHAMSL